jgi:hypothetical protein
MRTSEFACESSEVACAVGFYLRTSSIARRSICPVWESDARETQIWQVQILSGSSRPGNWLHFPHETGLHVENKASHGNIFCDPRM